jgi:hypothetical protein
VDRRAVGVIVALLVGSASAQPAGDAPENVEARRLERQPWQERRAQFEASVAALARGEPGASAEIERVLAAMERAPFTRTPMENMEILGAFVAPRVGAEEALPLIAANAALGWYDALRFASESGRAEILEYEGFFAKPFRVAGPRFAAEAQALLKEYPKRAAERIDRGLALADSVRPAPPYDPGWPTAYGLERIVCGLYRGRCAPVPALPRERWDEAWTSAKARVRLYYLDASH